MVAVTGLMGDIAWMAAWGIVCMLVLCVAVLGWFMGGFGVGDMGLSFSGGGSDIFMMALWKFGGYDWVFMWLELDWVALSMHWVFGCFWFVGLPYMGGWLRLKLWLVMAFW